MEKKRLLLKLKRDQKLLFKIQGSQEVIGTIKIDDAYLLRFVPLVLEFPVSLSITRTDAKDKF